VENEDLEAQAQARRAHSERITFSRVVGAIIVAITPEDRPQAFEQHGFTPRLPGPGNLKDVFGGIPGIARGIVADNAKLLLGAQPFGEGDQPYTSLHAIDDASFAVIESLNRVDGRLFITKIDDWPAQVRRDFLRRLETDQALRTNVASTVEGLRLLQERLIPLTPEDLAIAARLQVKREDAARKDGGGNPVVRTTRGAGNAVVDSIRQLDQLFAVNPPDP